MKINVETPLDDILPTENIRQSEKRRGCSGKTDRKSHDRWIPAGIAARVIVLRLKVRPPGQGSEAYKPALDITGTRTDGIIGEGAAFQDTLETVVEVGGNLPVIRNAGATSVSRPRIPLTAFDR